MRLNNEISGTIDYALQLDQKKYAQVVQYGDIIVAAEPVEVNWSGRIAIAHAKEGLVAQIIGSSFIPNQNQKLG